MANKVFMDNTGKIYQAANANSANDQQLGAAPNGVDSDLLSTVSSNPAAADTFATAKSAFIQTKQQNGKLASDKRVGWFN